MLPVAVMSFALLLVVAWMIAQPLLHPDAFGEEEPGSSLVSAKERLLGDIRDLDLDLATGKLDEEDHRRLRAAALADTAETLRAIEEEQSLDLAPGDDAGPASGSTPPDDRLEAVIAARKRAMTMTGCASCGMAPGPHDRFCRRCGADLPAPVGR